MRKYVVFAVTMLLSTTLVFAGCNNAKSGKDEEETKKSYVKTGQKKSKHTDDDKTKEAQKQADLELKAAIDVVKLMCPMSMGAAGEMTSVDYENGVVTYEYDLNEQFANVEVMAKNPEMVKKTASANFSTNANMKMLLERLVAVNGQMKYVMHGKTSGAVASATMTTEELKAVLEAKPDPQAALELSLEMANMQMPMRADPRLVIKEVKLLGDNVTYICEVDENQLSIDLMRQNVAAMKNQMKNSVSMMGMADRLFMQQVVEAGKNLAYKYVGNKTGKSLTVLITRAELSDVLN